MTYQVRITEVPAQLTGVVRLQAPLDQLSTVLPRACGEVWAFFRTSGLPRPGRNLALYHDDVMNIECGVEVSEPFTGTDRVFCSKTPAGRIATTVHVGPYHLWGEAHKAVQAWCKEHAHAVTGCCWEVYGHWNDDPAKVRTDVFWLLQDAPAS
jgi:effector-binding domain-containing protein